ncbi:unnamed protein product [Trifolium pratense]|uniref:Uncharacterized protein n=1 Tax=Trifolium pratense TaxID=57577 RepID=A0ACB0K6Z1_TRIPR|nr:unnamed protein product [Trifolium pratense]
MPICNTLRPRRLRQRLKFYHFKKRKGMSQLELEDEVQDDLKRATGEFTKDADDSNKLNRILQVTGLHRSCILC